MKEMYSFVPSEIPLPFVGILDRKDSKFLREIQEKAKEEFGEGSKQYKTIIGELDVENADKINFFFAIYLNKHLPENMRVPTAKDLERIVTLHPKIFRDVYVHSTDVLLTSEKSSFEPNKYLLKDLVNKIKKQNLNFSQNNPLVISGLELFKDNNPKNEYGFLLKTNKKTIFRNDLKYDWRQASSFDFVDYSGPIEGEGEGISAIGVNGGREIYANMEKLSESFDGDQIAIIYDIPHEKELLVYLKEIEEKKKQTFHSIQQELLAIQRLREDLSK